MLLFVQCPSLESVTVMKIAALLTDAVHSNFPIGEFQWTKSDIAARAEAVLKLLRQLPLPEKLKSKISAIIKPILLEIMRWKLGDNIQCGDDLDKRIHSKIYWTPWGTIDRRKTSQAILKVEELSTEFKLRLACKYCLEDDIPVLWYQLYEPKRNEFSEAASKNPILLFWSSVMNGGEESNHYHMLNCAIEMSNEHAIDYFWHKLPLGERVRCAMDALNRLKFDIEMHRETRFYLVSLLSQNDKKWELGTINSYQLDVLTYFLNVPLKSSFFAALKLLNTDLRIYIFEFLLKDIVRKMSLDHKDHALQELLKEFWHQSLPTYKEYIIRSEDDIFNIIYSLLNIGDKYSIKMLLEHLTMEDRKRIFYKYCQLRFPRYILPDYEKHNYFTSLKFLIHEYMPNRNEVQQLKHDIKVRQGDRTSSGIDRFFEFINDSQKIGEKRESESPTSKCKASRN